MEKKHKSVLAVGLEGNDPEGQLNSGLPIDIISRL